MLLVSLCLSNRLDGPRRDGRSEQPLDQRSVDQILGREKCTDDEISRDVRYVQGSTGLVCCSGEELWEVILFVVCARTSDLRIQVKFLHDRLGSIDFWYL
jgi:hypothetical protein